MKNKLEKLNNFKSTSSPELIVKEKPSRAFDLESLYLTVKFLALIFPFEIALYY